MEQKRLKPIVFTSNTISRGAQNTAQQLFLLKALQITKDPNELRKMIGVKTVAEVYRTLDKLAMRKEYHAALIRSGISLDFIVGGIKEIAVGGFKDSDKLNALKTLLTSLGMDKYEDDGGQTRGSWEEILLEKLEEEKKSKLLGDGKEKTDEPSGEYVTPVYEVIQPPVPESVKKANLEERKVLSSLYDKPGT